MEDILPGGIVQLIAMLVVAIAMIAWALFPFYWATKSALASKVRPGSWKEIRDFWTNPRVLRSFVVMNAIYLAAYFVIWWLLIEISRRLLPPGIVLPT